MRIKGFTLVELIVVIVILGILAATALPKFIDLRSDAEKSVVEGLVGAIGSARGLWVAKAALCGGNYFINGPFIFYNFIHFDSTPSRPPICDDFAAITDGSGISNGPVGTLDVFQIKQSLFADPDDEFGVNFNDSDNVLSFDTKSGRTVTIKINDTSGAISWSAVPSY